MARKILLADDSVTAQNMGRKILADAGYEVSTVNNGSAALKRIAEVKPDLIVLDVYMPGYSGLEVCQRLKEGAETAHIPVLLTVGKLEPFKPEEARRVRADAHIVKPFEASELLTAITRLEDRMVPPQADGSRFSTSVSGVERFGGDGGSKKTETTDDSDTGWKSRLRFPSKKKKEEAEPEPEDVAAAATFRDFRKTKGKSGSGLAFTVKEPAPAGQEPGLVPDIPRDITPEELDALSALAAKLDGPIPEAEQIAPLADKMSPEDAAVAVASAKAEAAKTSEAAKNEVEIPAATTGSKAEEVEEKEAKVESPVVESVVATQAEAVSAAVEARREVVIPVEHTELAATAGEADAGEAGRSSEAAPNEATSSEDAAAATLVMVNAAALAEGPAPVDRADEPKFDLVANAIALAAKKLIAEERLREERSASAGESEKTDAISNSVPAEAESKVAESKAEEAKPEEVKAAAPADEVEKPAAVEAVAEASVPEATGHGMSEAKTSEEPCEQQEPAPSDEELAEALRLLTPSVSNADVATTPSHGTLVAAGQLLAEEVARNAAAGPRWVAESVALSAEEATLSLEAEMFRTFASTPAAKPSGETEAIRVTGVSRIAAAVENRLAAFELEDSARAVAQQKAEPVVETTGSEALAGATAGESQSMAKEVRAAEVTEPEQIEEKSADQAKVAAVPALPSLETEKAEASAKESPADEVMGGTFADAVGNAAIEENSKRNDEAARETAAAATAETVAETENSQDSSSDVGGEDVASKSGKSNWHQIRTTPTSAAAGSDVVEAAKQAQGAEDAPKAMAAAAAAEGSSTSAGSTSASGTDAGTIASIVDSVMADLRPKIVEEIAKKLARK